MFTVVLDACVLFPQSLRDLLLRLASAGLFAPLWSERILEEMRKNVIAVRGVDPTKMDRTTRLMREAFEEAEVDPIKIESLEPAMLNAENDRHVLATAVAGAAELIVTANLRDFPREACDPLGISAIHPDEFLCDLFDLHTDTVYRVLAELVTKLRTTSFDEFLAMLDRAGVSEFVEAVRAHQQQRLAGS